MVMLLNTAPIEAWDAGVRWRTRRITAPTALAADVAYIRDLVLRAVNGPIEDDHIRRLILAGTQAYEEYTQKALMPQTWTMTLDRFPVAQIVLERPPLLSLTSVAYQDAAGAAQVLPAGSGYVLQPSGAYGKAEIWPIGGWPGTGSGPAAVTVTYEAGCADLTQAPELELDVQGIALFVSEVYTQRLLGVSGPQTPAQLHLDRFWKRAW